jgi:endo-1,3(4)-beta-glucanase
LCIDFANPIGIDSLILSAKELGASTVLTTDSHQAFSVNAKLAPSSGGSVVLTIPMVQGMGFVTGVYTSATPLIQSAIFFKNLSPLSQTGNTWKTTATLQDDSQWFIYVTPSSFVSSPPDIILDDSQTVRISSGFSGLVQIAKIGTGGQGESVYDSSAGSYATNCTVSASLSGNSAASYSLSWSKQGQSGQVPTTLLMFALPHHVQAFDGATNNAKTNITLQTTTKGIATAVFANKWTMIEQLPTR